jgi:hypothetical protein
MGLGNRMNGLSRGADRSAAGRIAFTPRRPRPNSRVTNCQIDPGPVLGPNSGTEKARLLTKSVFCQK